MSVLRVAVPVSKGKRRFHLDKGRTWSVIEHLVLTALAKKSWTAQALAEESKLPRRVVIEAIIRLMEASWIEFSQRPEGVIFRATELGKSVSDKEELPTNPRRIARWRSFITDRVTGTVFRGRELSVFEKHVLEKRAQQEQFVWIEPRDINNEDHVRSVVATLFDDDERFVSMEQSGDRLVDRFAVVTYRNDKVEGLPTRAPKELEEIIATAAKSFSPRGANSVTYKPQPVSAEVDPSNLIPCSVAFKIDDLILGADQHHELFNSIIKNCRHELIIHSTFVTDERLESVMPALTAAVHRGAKVDVLWGQGNEKSEVSTSKKAVDRLRQKVSSMALDDTFRIHPFSTRSHAKLIVADTGRPDRHVAVVGSCNWLSSSIQSFEASVRIREPSLVADVVDQLAELSLGEDGHWNWLSADPSEGNRRKEIGIFLHAAGAARRVIDVFEILRKS
jgi:cardiolipin synthase A/B